MPVRLLQAVVELATVPRMACNGAVGSVGKVVEGWFVLAQIEEVVVGVRHQNRTLAHYRRANPSDLAGSSVRSVGKDGAVFRRMKSSG